MKPTVTVHLVRHGETDWNAESRLQGWTDIALNEKGLQQAQSAASRLAQRPVAQIISSDLTRARQTAAPIAVRAGLEVLVDPALRERRFGVAEGRIGKDLTQEFGTQLGDHWANPDFTFEGGETQREVYARLGEFLRGRLAAPPDGELVLVIHAQRYALRVDGSKAFR